MVTDDREDSMSPVFAGGSNQEMVLREIYDSLEGGSSFRSPSEPHNRAWFTSSDMTSWQGVEEVDPVDQQVTILKLTGHVLVEDIPRLPVSLEKLTHLVELNVSKLYEITHLFDSIGSLTQLRTLNCTRCYKLQRLPESLGDCASLQTLILTDCESLKCLPNSIGKLSQLTLLKFGADTTSGCNAMTTLPASIGMCHQLQELDMTKCKFLTTLPKEIGNLVNLTELNLRECKKLGALPSEIGTLHNLRECSLSKCCGLSVLPPSMSDLPHLKRLNLSKCTGFTDGEGLLQVVSKISSLQVLNMRGCKHLVTLTLSSEDDGILFPALREWDLRGSKKLESLPPMLESFETLKWLDLRQCKKLVGLEEHKGLQALIAAGVQVLKDDDEEEKAIAAT